MAERIRVPSSDFIVLVRSGRAKPNVVTRPGVVEVHGGRRFDGNGYRPGERFGRRFSFGVDAPDRVDLVVGTKRTSLRDVERLLVGVGGRGGVVIPRSASEILGALARGQTVGGSDGSYQSEILDARQTHVLDNGAMMSIADDGPVYPDEMADSTELAEGPDAQVLGAGAGGAERVRGSDPGPFRDDFVDRLHEQAKAAIGPNGEVLDEFDQRFVVQQRRNDDMADTAAFVRISPRSLLTAGLLANQAVCVAGQASQQIAMWQGDDEETTPVTIAFSVVSPTIDDLKSGAWNSGQTFRQYGVVKFGTRNNLTRVEVDIGRGVVFSLNASTVILEAGLDPPNTTGGQTAGTMTLAGQMSFQSSFGRSPALTRTKYIDNLNNGATVSVPIPVFARNVALWRIDPSIACRLIVRDGAGIGFQWYDIPASTAMFTPIPLSGDAVTVDVQNTGALAVIGRLIFGLAF